jgi:SAM-dependent methyltransferase
MAPPLKPFRNVYEDPRYAGAYAALDWTGTYYLVRRDLPGILAQHVRGRRALDFGCGTGRSTRLLAASGFDVVGIDVSESMVERARSIDPEGRYVLVRDGSLAQIGSDFDLVLAAFPFDNIPNPQKRHLLSELRERLAVDGRLVNVISSPQIYMHEWTSFSTREYPENAGARDGDVVRIVTREFEHAQPAEDILCGPDCYRDVYQKAGLAVVATYPLLGRADDGHPWVSEMEVPPWIIDVLKRASTASGLQRRDRAANPQG